MTEPASSPKIIEAATPLPHATILSYFDTNSPTRVRIVAARALWIVGILCLGTAAWFIYGIAREVVPELKRLTGFGEFLDMARDYFAYDPIAVLVAILLPLPGVVVCCCTVGVKRGRKVQSLIALVGILPLATCVFLTTLGLVMVGMLEGSGLVPGAVHRGFLWLLLPAAMGIIVLLLLKDLIAFLFWIFRNPATERRTVAFLTGKQRP